MANQMFLLGAGASVEADVPGAYAMTQKIAERFQSNWQLKQEAHALSFVIGGLLMQEGIRGNNPLQAGVNVEDLFNAVQILADRNTLEAAPFVGSWHAMVEQFDKVQPSRANTSNMTRIIFKSVAKEILSALSQSPSSSDERRVDEALDKTLKSTLDAYSKTKSGSSFSMPRNSGVGSTVAEYVKTATNKWADRLKSASPNSGFDMDREIASLVNSQQAQPGEGRIFHDINKRMIRTLREFVWIKEADRVQHLSPMLNVLQEQPRLVIGSLNYDNAIELLALQHRISCTTGIQHWSEKGSFIFPDEGINLLKLHGSIDWRKQQSDGNPDRPMAHSIIRQVRLVDFPDEEHNAFEPAVTFGQRNKLTADGPFLDLLRAFQQELSASSQLTVIGYSFRDPHINIFVSQWLNQSREHQMRVIDPSFPNQAIPYTQELIQLQRTNPEQITIISSGAKDGLLQLYGNFIPHPQ